MLFVLSSASIRCLFFLLFLIEMRRFGFGFVFFTGARVFFYRVFTEFFFIFVSARVFSGRVASRGRVFSFVICSALDKRRKPNVPPPQKKNDEKGKEEEGKESQGPKKYNKEEKEEGGGKESQVGLHKVRLG